MASTGQKWLIGCGIGCGVIILLILLLIGTGVFFASKAVQGFKAVEEVNEELETRYGAIDSYCPPADGGITDDRIVRFVAVRDSLIEVSGEITDRINELSDNIQRLENDNVKSFSDVFQMITKGAGVVPQLADYYYTRNRALLANGMGPGEYLYLYFTVYYGFLGYDPGDGPPFKIMDHHNRRRGLDWESGDEDDLSEAEIRANRRLWVISMVHELMLPMLECQLDSLETCGAVNRGWKRALNREVEAMRADPDRLVWKDGLPSALSDPLAPYRTELALRYDAMLNPLEVMTALDDD